MENETTIETLHGVTIEDQYMWMENTESARTKNWVAEQDAKTRSILNKLPLREKLAARLKELMDVGSFSAFNSRILKNPETGQTRYFQYRRDKDQKFEIFYYKDGLDGEQKIAIDPNKFSEDGSLSLHLTTISRDGRKIAYQVSKNGSDRTTTYVLDIDTGKLLSDVLPDIRYMQLTWLPDDSGFYYLRWPDQNYEGDKKYKHRVYLHKLGTDFNDDVPIFGEGFAPDIHVYIEIPFNSKYLFITKVLGPNAKDIYYKNLGTNSEIKPLIMGKKGNFGLDVVGDTVYLYTDLKAPRGKIVRFNIDTPEETEWETIIPEKEDILYGFSIKGGKICLSYLSNVHERLFVYDLDGKEIVEVPLPEFGEISGPGGVKEGKEFFFIFDSFTVPQEHYRFDLEKLKLTLLERKEVELDFKKFEVKQVWSESKDGTKIPMFIVHKKGLELNGKNPTLLYGYGGFRISELPPMYLI